MVTEPQVVVVSPYAPSSVGHGGNHRSYQILCDVQECVGTARTWSLSLDEWHSTHPEGSSWPRPSSFLERAQRSLSFRWNTLSENPLRLLADTHFTARGMLHPGFVAEYRRMLQGANGAVICVSEHPMFDTIRQINADLGIPTILCSHNLDALSQNLPALAGGESTGRRRWPAYAAAADFVGEIEAMRLYDERLLISRVETAVVGGLGLNCHYYPYAPKGAIRERNLHIRQRRSSTTVDPALFLVMGSARHYPTRVSLEWFVTNACRYGLPPATSVVVAGHDTEKLAGNKGLPAGLELRGWLDQEELDNLLTRVCAVLVPQKLGFGTLTRLPELSCAGIPTLTTPFPTYALDPPPGLRSVEGDWDEWCAALDCQRRESRDLPESAYLNWERRQALTLAGVLRQMEARL